MVGVENDGDTVGRRNGADVVSGSNGTSDGGGLVLVVDALAGEVCGTTYDQSINCSNSMCRGVDLPWEVWRMMGDLASRAASSEATTVEEEVT